MRRIKLRSTRWLLSAAASLLLIVGCSTEMIPSTAPETETQSSTLTEPIPLPNWTDEDIANLIPGYQVLRVDRRGQSDQLDDQASRYIRRIFGGSVACGNNGCQIGPWQLGENRTVTVSVPDDDNAIVDFLPHPYQFNGHIRIWIDLSDVVLPPGMHWWDIQMFYVDESGNLHQYWGFVDLLANQYVAWTDHFSRYILATPAND